jgi:hypothetical protein
MFSSAPVTSLRRYRASPRRRIDPAEVRKIYFWMVKEKILVRISDDLAYHRETLEQIKHKVHAARPGSAFGVAEFRTCSI